mmetsp:Transcript_13006/g.35016  ORF Transcript_13006/g.35016 Transcript_13006/m.35016 type:complete len:221 (-) Transcript_13006:591-1253(-)
MQRGKYIDGRNFLSGLRMPDLYILVRKQFEKALGRRNALDEAFARNVRAVFRVQLCCPELLPVPRVPTLEQCDVGVCEQRTCKVVWLRTEEMGNKNHFGARVRKVHRHGRCAVICRGRDDAGADGVHVLEAAHDFVGNHVGMVPHHKVRRAEELRQGLAVVVRAAETRGCILSFPHFYCNVGSAKVHQAADRHLRDLVNDSSRSHNVRRGICQALDAFRQ